MVLPLVQQGWTTNVATGARPAPTVALFNLWTYERTADRAARGFAGYWDAPIFHPYRGTFAMSDPQPLTGLAYAGLRAIASPVAAMNVLLVLVLIANGVGAGLLAIETGLSRVAQAVASVLAVWLPFCVEELGTLQMIVLFPVFGALTFLYRFHRRSSIGDAVGLAASMSACYWTSGYWGLWLALLVVSGGVVLFRKRHANRQTAVAISTAAVLVALICGPVVYFQQQSIGDLRWDGEYVDTLAAAPIDYVRTGDRNLASAAPWTVAAGDWPIRLYPGVAAAGLACVGVALGWRSQQRGWILFLLMAIQAAFLLSLGRIEPLANFSPMSLLQQTVPGFDKLRSPYRVGMFVSLLMTPLAAIGADRACSIRPALWRGLALSAVVLAICEFSPLSAPVATMDVGAIAQQMETSPAWCAALAEEPEGPVIHLPMGRDEISYLATVEAMLLQRHHGKPLVGGYSGFLPPSVRMLEKETSPFPDRRSAALLLTAGVRYLVVDKSRMEEAALERLAQLDKLLPLVIEDRAGGVLVHRFSDRAYQHARHASQSQPREDAIESQGGAP